MWALLSNPGHAESFAPHGENYAPLSRLVAELAGRSYAGGVFAFKSMTSFHLTTAATYQDFEGHDAIGIGFGPRTWLFGVGYDQWVSPTRNPQRRTVACRSCVEAGVSGIVDLYVLRLLLTR